MTYFHELSKWLLYTDYSNRLRSNGQTNQAEQCNRLMARLASRLLCRAAR